MNAPPKPQSTPEIRKETYPILFYIDADGCGRPGILTHCPEP